MPETAEQFYARVAAKLSAPPVEDWDQWPFEGPVRPRELDPPQARDLKREGEGGVDCFGCTQPDERYIWTNDRWRLMTLKEPSGMPLILLLESRAHYAEPGDLPEDLALELGPLLVRIERSARAIDGVGRVHVCRWGDGSEHLHWWFIARPARFDQLVGSFAAIWDDVLPPTPEPIWSENVRIFLDAFTPDAPS